MPRTYGRLRIPSPPRGFVPIAALLFVVVASLSLLTHQGLLVMSGIRAISSGSAHWIHAEKEAIHHLGRYLRTGGASDGAVYSRHMETLRASNVVVALLRDAPIGDHETFLDAMIRLGYTRADARNLLDSPTILWRHGPARRPLEVLIASAPLVERLASVGRRVRPPNPGGAAGAADAGSGRLTVKPPPGGAVPGSPGAEAVLAELAEVDARIDGLLHDFTTELSAAGHETRLLILAAVGVSGLLLLAGALALVHRTLAAEQARDKSEERLQVLLQQTPLHVWTVDRKLILRSMQGEGAEAWERMIGRRLEDIIARGSGNQDAVAAHEGAVAGRASDYDTVWRGRTFRVHVEPLRGSDGGIDGAVGVALDVTQRAEIEAERTRLEAQFREAQKMEAVGRLAGGIAHDFNNLLTVVRGNATLLETEAESEEIQQIHDAVDKAQKLTRQLLAYSRREPSAPQRVRVGSLVESLEPMLRAALGEAVELRLTLNAEDDHVRADPRQMEPVILNLAINARHAMAGSGHLEITADRVSLPDGDVPGGCPVEIDAGEYVLLTVEDDGHGIPRKDLQRIFEPFFSTRDPAEGSGLGLAMVYGVVKQAGGFVWADSREGEGTRMYVMLPSAGEPEEGQPRGQGSASLSPR